MCSLQMTTRLSWSRLIAAQMGQALHVLDRFHINGHPTGNALEAPRTSVSRLWGLTRTSEPGISRRLTMFQQGLFDGWHETLGLL